MAQASGSHFKLVYQDWITVDGKRYPAPNTLHPAVIKRMEENANKDGFFDGMLRAPFFEENFQSNQSGYYFRHSNFASFFIKHFGYENIVEKVSDDDCEYFYPIEIERNGLEFLSSESEFLYNGEKLVYKFEDVINKDVLNHLKTGNLKIVVNNIIDPGGPMYFVDKLTKQFKSMGIKPSNIVFMFGNTPYIFKDYKEEFGCTIVNSILSLQQASKTIKSFPQHNHELNYINDNVKPEDLNNLVIRNKKFLCFNRTMNRPHRLAMAYLALKYNLLESGTFSFLTHLGNKKQIEENLTQLITEDDISEYADKIIELVPYEIDTSHLSNQQKESFQTVTANKKEFYLDSYFHIVSETSFNMDEFPFFSEKTWRPMINLQPFIYLGNYKALAKIKEFGFKTFDKWIDESYDNMHDPKDRFALIQKEILRLNNMHIKEIHNMYYEMTDILLHNQALIKTFEDYNPLEELFKNGN